MQEPKTTRLNQAERNAMLDLESMSPPPMETTTVAIYGGILDQAVSTLRAEYQGHSDNLKAIAIQLGAHYVRHVSGGGHVEAYFTGKPPRYKNASVWIEDKSLGANWYILDRHDQFAQQLYDELADRLGPYNKWLEARILALLFPTLKATEALTDEVFSQELSGYSVRAHLASPADLLFLSITAPGYSKDTLTAYMKLRKANAANPMGDHMFEECDSLEASLLATSLYERGMYGEGDTGLIVDNERVHSMVARERKDLHTAIVAGAANLRRAADAAGRKAAAKKVVVTKGKKIALPSPVADVGDNHPEAMKLYAKRTRVTKKSAGVKA